jgi:hypothetical protein
MAWPSSQRLSRVPPGTPCCAADIGASVGSCCSCSTPSGARAALSAYAAAAAAPLPVSLLARPLANYPEAATAFHRVGCSAVGVAT